MHRCHDYRHLVARWRKVAARAGVRLRKLAKAGGDDLFYLRTPALSDTGGIYISAAIHGDEPASSEGLIAWAEKVGSKLGKIPLLLFPCLNPCGLRLNTRHNENGEDLNRMFHRADSPVIGAVREVVGDRKFALSLQLHEDYDAEGIYIYEVQSVKPYWGERLLKAGGVHLPIEVRTRIDGRKASGGLVRRRVNFRRFEKIGYPEAIWMHLEHSERTFTVETPSELALEQRIRAQVAVIEAAVELALA